jgi:lipid II:glycine glycyltransferase (peptidoglycan interpeptide bridge formation enzyme)
MIRLKWNVMTIDGVNIFIRRFPILGGIAKIHRPEHLPSPKKLIPILKKYSVRTLVVEPTLSQNQKQLNGWIKTMSGHVTINSSAYLPTKTIRIELTGGERGIFNDFSEAKRRAVRRAAKLGVIIHESQSIRDLIRIKNKSGGLFGFITTTGIDKMWEVFGPEHMSILLAYDAKQNIIGGILLLFWDGIAYYWIAGATKEGKKLFAPTLLVWEAIKVSKKNNCNQFDFVGVWDERVPRQKTEWHGFTKFKEGFGGKELYYPLVLCSF